MTRAEIYFKSNRLEIRSADISVDEGHPLGKEDGERFNTWIQSYRHALN
jgi:hypothetical protein